MSEDSDNGTKFTVVQFPESSLLIPPRMLRILADDIEKGEYGTVGCVAVVVAGNTLEVFSSGPTSDTSNTITSLQAGALKLLSDVVDKLS